MNTPNSIVRDGWFVAARTKGLGRKPLAVTILGRALVLARSQDGRAFALDDCCPHRHVPLSGGKVTAHGLQCPYHGWTFDASGMCTAMPGVCDQSCKRDIRVSSLPVFEHDGLIWIRWHDYERPSVDNLPPFLAELPVHANRFIWQSSWQADVADALENLLDPMHTHFIHPGVVRRDNARRPVEVHVNGLADGIEVSYRGNAEQSGLLYRLFESRRTEEIARFSAVTPGTGQIGYRYANGSAITITVHFTPGADNQLHVFGTLHVVGRSAPRWAVRALLWPFLRRVAKQDQTVVETQFKNKRKHGRGTGVITEADFVRPVLDDVWSRGVLRKTHDSRILKVTL